MPERITPPFPIFLNLDGAQVLVVGDGDVAARRIEAVVRAGAQVRLATTKIGAPLKHLMELERVTPLNRGFQPEDIEGCRLVMVATDDDDLNARVSALAQAAGIPVNVADNLALCTFIMPAIVDRAPITAAISSGGTAPVLARRVKTAIEAVLPANLGDLAAYAGQVRPQVNMGIADPKARRRFWQNFADGPIATHVLDGKMNAASQLVEKSIRELAAGQAINPVGEILIIAAGAGDPDMLSFRALRLMQRGDAMVHDSDVPIAILDIARKDAERIVIDDADTAWQRVSAMANDGLSVMWVRRGAPDTPDATALDGSGIVITSVPASC